MNYFLKEIHPPTTIDSSKEIAPKLIPYHTTSKNSRKITKSADLPSSGEILN